ncbi:MAG: PPC domain-containing protein [Terricaulis sp.]
MRQILVAAAAVLALAACSPANSGAPMPKQQNPQNALNAPTHLNGGSAAEQASITPEQDQQLRQLITNILNNYQEHFAPGMGPAPGAADQIAAIQPGHDYRWQVNMQGGKQYKVLGGCDNECNNVDIELIDGSGAVVANDTAPDDRPVVSFTPASNGQYIVRMILQTCTVGPCYVGARVVTEGVPSGLSKKG